MTKTLCFSKVLISKLKKKSFYFEKSPKIRSRQSKTKVAKSSINLASGAGAIILFALPLPGLEPLTFG
jgi:hypothetical protein